MNEVTGRFLLKNNALCDWEQISDNDAYVKIAQALQYRQRLVQGGKRNKRKLDGRRPNSGKLVPLQASGNCLLARHLVPACVDPSASFQSPAKTEYAPSKYSIQTGNTVIFNASSERLNIGFATVGIHFPLSDLEPTPLRETGTQEHGQSLDADVTQKMRKPKNSVPSFTNDDIRFVLGVEVHHATRNSASQHDALLDDVDTSINVASNVKHQPCKPQNYTYPSQCRTFQVHGLQQSLIEPESSTNVPAAMLPDHFPQDALRLTGQSTINDYDRLAHFQLERNKFAQNQLFSPPFQTKGVVCEPPVHSQEVCHLSHHSILSHYQLIKPLASSFHSSNDGVAVEQSNKCNDNNSANNVVGIFYPTAPSAFNQYYSAPDGP